MEGNPVCLGIRPRALCLAKEETPSISFFEGKVELSEMLGEEVLLHIQSGRHQYITSVHPHEAAALDGNIVRLVPQMDTAQVFDAKIGRNLTLPREIVESA